MGFFTFIWYCLLVYHRWFLSHWGKVLLYLFPSGTYHEWMFVKTFTASIEIILWFLFLPLFMWCINFLICIHCTIPASFWWFLLCHDVWSLWWFVALYSSVSCWGITHLFSLNKLTCSSLFCLGFWFWDQCNAIFQECLWE